MALTKTPIELSSTPGIVDNSNATAITIDASENVGIGVTNPSDYYANNLVVGAGSEGGITIASSATTYNNYLAFADGSSSVARYAGLISYDHNINDMHFRTSSLERMRINSTGLVGISTSSPDSLLHVSGVANLRVAYNGTSVNYMDADTNIFRSGNGIERMRILSTGGITFNGDTAQANALDDYEEGTWTMGITTSSASTTSITNTTGRYTKIGSLVTVSIYTEGINVSNAGGGTTDITGLPFTVAGSSDSYSAASFAHTTLFSTTYEAYGAINTTFARVTQVGSTANASLSAGTPKYMMFTMTYHTNQ